MQLVPIMRLAVEVRPPISAGPTPHGEVRVLPFVGGTWETVPAAGEERVVGSIADGGTDWQTVRGDGVLEIRARYLLETADEERIEVLSEGIRSATPDVLARLAAGDTVDPSDYYFRTHLRFATGAARFAHLNDLLGVAVGERRAHGVDLTAYAIP